MSTFEEQFPSLKKYDWCHKIGNKPIQSNVFSHQEIMECCLDKQKIWFYKCAKCKKETFSDLNNFHEPKLCADCQRQKVREAIDKLENEHGGRGGPCVCSMCIKIDEIRKELNL